MAVSTIGPPTLTLGDILYLGIDIGTSACRACVIDDSAQIRAFAQSPWLTADRRMPTDAESWRHNVFAVVTQVCRASNPGAIRAISVAGTSATLMAVDPQGSPLSPALIYDDARAVKEAHAIKFVAPETSASHGPSSALAKWLWLKNKGLPQGARAASQSDWVTGQFLEAFTQGDENNALKLGYDPVTHRWPDWLYKLGVETRELPSVFPAGTPLGLVSASIAARFGFSTEMVIAAGTTDSIAAFIASGARKPKEAVSSLGSTLVVKLLTRQPLFSSIHGIYSHPLGAFWLAGGASNSGGAVLKTFFPDEEIERLSRSIDPEVSSGLDYYPLLKPGERFPINDPERRPRIEPRPAEPVRFLHGLLEGIANIEKQGYETLASLGADYPRRVLSVGGGALNPTWSAIRSRILGIPVMPARNTEAAYGAAMLASWSAGSNPYLDIHQEA